MAGLCGVRRTKPVPWLPRQRSSGCASPSSVPREPNPETAPTPEKSTLDAVLTPNEDSYHLALHDAADIMGVLREQTERAYGAAINERAASAICHESELPLQPGLIERLEAAVDHGHDLVVLLAECAIATAEDHDS
ncbi:hypothetical protein [Streptomyces sp. NPDC055134]